MTLVELYNRACDSGANTAGKNTQYTISSDEQNVYLSIQGSCDDDDWRFNFSFWVKPYRHMKHLWLSHAGFTKAWKLAADQISEQVRSLLGNRRLVIMGFSHGAAVAVLAHEYFTYEGFNPETHAFGCPRVLWMPSRFIRKRFESLTLYQARGDIVTHIPFAVMGYAHVGKVLKFGPKRPITHLPHTLPNYRSILA